MKLELRVGDKVKIKKEYLLKYGKGIYSNSWIKIIPSTKYTSLHCVNVDIDFNTDGGLNVPISEITKIKFK